MSDPLIEQLVAELAPRQPLANARLWGLGALGLAIFSAIILGLFGPRGDMAQAILSGVLFWKVGLLFSLWLGCMLLTAAIARPDGAVQPWHGLPLLLGLAILLWQGIVQSTASAPLALLHSLRDASAFTCVSIILCGGAVALGIGWKLWLGKTASPHPALLGFLAGTGAGALAATSYALHCDRDTITYISAYYLLPALALGAIGSALGRKYLIW